MFRAFSRLSSGAQWPQWQPLVLPSYRGDSRAVFVVGPADGGWGSIGIRLCVISLILAKVKCTLVQALRLCTARTACRGSRGIALPILDHGTRRGWGISVTPRPLFNPGKDPVPLYRRLGGAQGRSGQVRKISSPPGFDPRTVQPVASRYTDYATRPNISSINKRINCNTNKYTIKTENKTLRQMFPYNIRGLLVANSSCLGWEFKQPVLTKCTIYNQHLPTASF